MTESDVYSLEALPLFTKREIDSHVENCGKLRNKSIRKTLLRGKKFKEERYINFNSLFTSKTSQKFIIKCRIKASMKKVFRSDYVHINRTTSKDDKAYCNCPAGKSG